MNLRFDCIIKIVSSNVMMREMFYALEINENTIYMYML